MTPITRPFSGAHIGGYAEVARDNQNVQSYGKATAVSAEKGQSLWSYDTIPDGAYAVNDIIDLFGNTFEAGTIFLRGIIHLDVAANLNGVGELRYHYFTRSDDGTLSATTTQDNLTVFATQPSVPANGGGVTIGGLPGYCAQGPGYITFRVRAAFTARNGVGRIAVEYIA